MGGEERDPSQAIGSEKRQLNNKGKVSITAWRRDFDMKS